MKLFYFLLLSSLAVYCVALKNPECGEPHSKDGNCIITCMAYMPSWSYDSKENTCKRFIYGGCFGNANQFDSEEQCLSKCRE